MACPCVRSISIPARARVLRCSVISNAAVWRPSTHSAASRGPSEVQAALRESETRPRVALRQGAPGDLSLIVQAVAREWLNPLGLQPARFTVATSSDESGNEIVLGWGQLKPVGSTEAGGTEYELATLVTLQPHRGKGVGSAVVRALLDRTSISDRVLLMTTTGRARFYERLGFKVLPSDAVLPGTIQFERSVGGVIAPLVTGGQQLVVMEAHKSA